MSNNPEDFTHLMPPREELLELLRDIRDELRQIRETSESQRYQRNDVEAIKTSIADAASNITYAIESLQKDLMVQLAPLTLIIKALELGKDLTKRVDDSTFLLAKKLDEISKTLD